MITQNYFQVMQGIALTAYGIEIQAEDSKNFRSPLAFDAHDLWLGDDFDFFIDNMLDDLFDDIEADLKSVWSSNKSEQESQDYSARRSALASYLGQSDDASLPTEYDAQYGDISGASMTSGGSDTAGGTSLSQDSSALSSASPTHGLSDHSGYKHGHGFGHFHHPLESRYSGTESDNLDGDTQDSHSHGTSNRSGPSTVSTQSIQLRQFTNRYANNTAGRTFDFRAAEDSGNTAAAFARRSNKTLRENAPGGVVWEGDADNEYIWGTMWQDQLSGGDGDDLIYGLEDDDFIEGGEGDNKLFGDKGDDTIFAFDDAALATMNGEDGTNLLSGGHGNDRLYGNMGGDVLFGGPGHDLLYGGYGTAYDPDNANMGATIIDRRPQLYGGDGDDEIVASYQGRNEIFGGNGDDMILGGILDFVDPTPNDATAMDGGLGYMPLIPRRSTMPLAMTTDPRRTQGAQGDLDIDAGAGNDFIVGAFASDDIFGGEGNDVIYGAQPENAEYTLAAPTSRDNAEVNMVITRTVYGDDDIDGGRGDDIIFGVAMDEQLVLRGGEGQDTIYAGQGNVAADGSDKQNLRYDATPDTEIIWIYGDDGHDEIWGADDIPFQYLRGGEGDDLMYGGDDIAAGGLNYMHGGDGDDIILPGNVNKGETIVRGGKGDDQINVYNEKADGTSIINDDGTYDFTELAMLVSKNSDQNGLYDGGDGDDEVWGPWDLPDMLTSPEPFRLYGGNGDDTIKGGWKNPYGLFIAGEGGQDTIDTQWINDGATYTDQQITNGDLVIFGDWGYGSGTDPFGDYTNQRFDSSAQLQDVRLDSQLQGDDDVILLGQNDPTAIINDAFIFAGDGDDLVDIDGEGWFNTTVYGQEGNDTFIVNGGFTDRTSGLGGSAQNIEGGKGNDTFKQGTNDDGSILGLSATTSFYGDEGNDKFEEFINTTDDPANVIRIYGGDGDDKIGGASMFEVIEIFGEEGNDVVYGGEQAEYGQQDIMLGGGNDTFFGGNGGSYGTIVGNDGNDKIFGPDNVTVTGGAAFVKIYGDDDTDTEGTSADSDVEGDGSDIIDFGDYNDIHYGWGRDGNDKIIGGQHNTLQKLYGELGDDMMWSINEDQRGSEIMPAGATGAAFTGPFMYGGGGNDKMFGNDLPEYLVGDSYKLDEDASNLLVRIMYGADLADYYNDTDIGDDAIYGYGGDDAIFGQQGDDKLDGGLGNDLLVGGKGDDKVFGGDGDDLLYGDQATTDSHDDSSQSTQDDLVIFGDDKMYGGAGLDTMYASFGDDFMKGGDDADIMYGGAGEDTIYGEAGDDLINAGYGWDTIFGGDGCEDITVIDGGDVVWLGDCDGVDDMMNNRLTRNTLNIEGTGDNPENFVVVMDFWLESAKPFNEICLNVGVNQANPSAPICRTDTGFSGNAYVRSDNDGICVDATEIADPEQLYNELDSRALEGGEWRGSGCKHDGGPLWISIPIADDPVVAQETTQRSSNYYYNTGTSGYFENDGGNAYAMTIWARFFQRAHKQPVIDRKKPRITSYNSPERYEYSSRYESQGRDLAGGSDDSSNRGYGSGGYGYGYRPPQNDGSSYYPRISHRGYWSQTESVSHHDEELVECLRIWLCDTETTQYSCIGGTGAGGACGTNT